jgi:transposase
MTIGGVNAIVAIGVLAAIGDIARFSSPEKLVSYFGLNPGCGNRETGRRIMGGSANRGARMPVRC